jgi:hypothetical protein
MIRIAGSSSSSSTLSETLTACNHAEIARVPRANFFRLLLPIAEPGIRSGSRADD